MHCRLRPQLKFDLINVPERLVIQVKIILDKGMYWCTSSKQPIIFADDEETVVLHYGRPSHAGAVTEERIFEFDR